MIDAATPEKADDAEHCPFSAQVACYGSDEPLMEVLGLGVGDLDEAIGNKGVEQSEHPLRAAPVEQPPPPGVVERPAFSLATGSAE